MSNASDIRLPLPGAHRWCRAVCIGLAVLCGIARPGGIVHAQTVQIDGPAGATLRTVTPAFTVRAVGFGTARPLYITVQIATTVNFGGDMVFDSTVVTNDTVVVVQSHNVLPPESNVYWKARVQSPGGPVVESATVGPRTSPAWLTLISPNSPAGDILDQRIPRLVWASPDVTPAVGPWLFDVAILSQGRVEQNAEGITDTTWRVTNELQANASYRWRVRAYLRNGATVTVNSAASFVVKDQPLPLTTLLYQNFPNPFPTAAAFATCIWFDIAEPGARVTLDVTDLRGNLVRTLIPGPDGQRDFLPGRYGQGVPGSGSSCDNRFVWDGTGNDGRTVAQGVYLLRFQAGRHAPTFRRMLFLGR